MLASATSGAEANFVSSQSIVASVGREYIHDMRPSANMFFARCLSLLPSGLSSSAPTVIVVMGTSKTW